MIVHIISYVIINIVIIALQPGGALEPSSLARVRVCYAQSPNCYIITAIIVIIIIIIIMIILIIMIIMIIIIIIIITVPVIVINTTANITHYHNITHYS